MVDCAELILPTGDYTATFSSSPGGNNFSCVDDHKYPTGDTDTSYVYVSLSGFGAGYDMYNMSDIPINNLGVICGVTTKAAWKRWTSGVPPTGVIYMRLRTHGTVFSAQIADTAPGTYKIASHTWNNNPSTSAAWTWAEVNDLKCGIKLEGLGSGELRCTRVFAEIHYVSPKNVEVLVPVSDITANLTRVPASAVTNYELVNELVSDQNNYVNEWATTSYVTDIYGLSSSTHTAGEAITGVTVLWNGDSNTFGITGWGMKRPLLRVNGTIYNGTVHYNPALTAHYTETWAENPDTSAAWTWTAINSLQAGIGIVSEGPWELGYCYHFNVLVSYCSASTLSGYNTATSSWETIYREDVKAYNAATSSWETCDFKIYDTASSTWIKV